MVKSHLIKIGVFAMDGIIFHIHDDLSAVTMDVPCAADKVKAANSNFELHGPARAHEESNRAINLRCCHASNLLDSNAGQALVCQLTGALTYSQSYSSLSTYSLNAPRNLFPNFTAAFPSLPSIHSSI